VTITETSHQIQLMSGTNRTLRSFIRSSTYCLIRNCRCYY